MAQVRRTPQAEADLVVILTDLDSKDPTIAGRYAVEFAEKARILGQFPESGRSRPEIAPNLRRTVVSP